MLKYWLLCKYVNDREPTRIMELGFRWDMIASLDCSVRIDGFCALFLFIRHMAPVRLWNPVLAGMSVGLVLLVDYFICVQFLGWVVVLGFIVGSGSWWVQPVEGIWAGLPW